MTDRDDALRRELGWTGPEESDDEPDTGRAGPAEPSPPADSLAPRRPPVDFVPPEPQESAGESTPADEPQPFSTGAHRLPPEPPPPPSQPEGPRGGPADGPPPVLDPNRPRDRFREPPQFVGSAPPAIGAGRAPAIPCAQRRSR